MQNDPNGAEPYELQESATEGKEKRSERASKHLFRVIFSLPLHEVSEAHEHLINK